MGKSERELELEYPAGVVPEGERRYAFLDFFGKIVLPSRYELYRNERGFEEAYYYTLKTPEGESTGLYFDSKRADSNWPNSFTASWLTIAPFPKYLRAVNTYYEMLANANSESLPASVDGYMHGGELLSKRYPSDDFTTDFPLTQQGLEEASGGHYGQDLEALSFLRIDGRTGSFVRDDPFLLRLNTSFADVKKREDLLSAVEEVFDATADPGVTFHKPAWKEMLEVVSGDLLQRNQKYIRPKPEIPLTPEQIARRERFEHMLAEGTFDSDQIMRELVGDLGEIIAGFKNVASLLRKNKNLPETEDISSS